MLIIQNNQNKSFQEYKIIKILLTSNYKVRYLEYNSKLKFFQIRYLI